MARGQNNVAVFDEVLDSYRNASLLP